MQPNTSPLRVLITGGSDGIGLEVARQYIVEGAEVLLVARNADRLALAATSLGGHVETASVDLTDADALEGFIQMLNARGYWPDVLVNNAGHGASGAFVEADWARLDALLKLNVVALGRLSHWAATRMKAVGRGAIVNLSAAVATRPVPWFATYAASKAFVTNLSQALHYELRRHSITVAAIHPPAVRTSFADEDKADLRTTLVLRLFPAVSAATVARAVRAAARGGRRSVIVGPFAAIVMGTAPIMPRMLDLPFMSLLFKTRRVVRPGATNAPMTPVERR